MSRRNRSRWLGFSAPNGAWPDKTLEAYARDVGQFLDFLAGHLGSAPALKQLRQTHARGCARLHGGAARRGAGSRSLMRVLAGARSFARFLERNGKGKVGALAAVRAPKVGRPRQTAGHRRRQTHFGYGSSRGRRPRALDLARDAAVLALLYGSGLRISEALSLKRKESPESDAITVTGKGNKTRMVPVLPQVDESIAGYLAALPASICQATARCSSVRAAGRCRPALCNWRWRGYAARSACPIRRRRMHCGTRLLRICWRAAAICARFRNCSATPRCRPRRFTRRSIPSVYWKFIRAPIRARNPTSYTYRSPLRAGALCYHRCGHAVI